MSEDITFCSVVCECLECERNKAHIRLDIPHSFADFKGDKCCILEKHSTEKVIQASNGMMTVLTNTGEKTKASYKAILELDKRLTAAEIPHITERSLDGWIVVYPSFEDRVGDAIQHRMSYGAKHDLLEVYGFGLKEPVGWADVDKAFAYFKEAHEKAQEKGRKRARRKKQ